jgi:CHAT domain-containing protein/tetratricopeptide (TPR) repeat protein
MGRRSGFICRGWSLVAIILVAIAFPSITANTARAQAQASRAARDQIKQALAAFGDAEKRGDAGAALKKAEEADRLARMALAPTDSVRAEAVRALGRIRCAAAVKEGNSRAALGFAEEVRDAAADAHQLEPAIDWARYAVTLAALVKDRDARGDPVERASLSLARLEMEQAWVANDTARARDRAREAVRLAERVLVPGDSRRLKDVLTLAVLEHRAGSVKEASRLYDQIADLGKPYTQQNAEFVVEAMINCAGILMAQESRGEREATARLVEAARAANALPASRASDAQLLSLLDETFWNPLVRQASRQPSIAAREAWLGDIVGRIQEALRKAKAPPAWVAQGSLRLSRFQFELQRVDATESTLETVARAVVDLKEAPTVLGDYFSLRGNVETERSNFALARAHHVQAYNYYKDARSNRQANALNNLGQVLIRQGDYRVARQTLSVAERLRRKEAGFRDDVALAIVLTNLARAMEGDGDSRDAEALYKDAIGLLAASPAPEADKLFPQYTCRVNRGVNIFSSGDDLEEAAAEFGRARDLAAKAFEDGHFHVGEVEVNLGWVALAEKKPEQARDHFVRAFGIFRDKLGNDHPRTAEAMGYVARANTLLGRRDEAVALLEEAMDLREKYLGRMFRSALAEYDRVALVRALRIHSESPAYAGLLDTYLELAPSLKIPVSGQYRRMLTWKGIVARHAPPLKDELEADPKVRALAEKREEAIKRLRAAVSGASTTGLGIREAEVDRLERQLAELSPRFQRGRDEGALTPHELEGKLEPGWAFLDVLQVGWAHTGSELSTGDHRYLGFLVGPGRPLYRIDFPGPEGKELDSGTAIDAAVVEFRNALKGNDDGYLKPAAVLKTSIKDPLDPHLKGVKLLIVSHDGQLHRLPFGALPGGRPGSHWIEEVSFATVPSARSLVNRGGAKAGSGAEGMLIVGGVDYGKHDPVTYKYLEGTEVEAKIVARIFGEVHKNELEMVGGSDATLDRLRASMPRQRFIHIATHGFFNGSDEAQESLRGVTAMLDSGLVLSGANSQRPDTLLSSEQIAFVDLRAVELVVLSACESALGHVKAGQGTTGLLDAFDRAGAGSMVCALWKVDDEATAALMAAFYDHLWRAGLAPPDALRAAQLELIRGTKKSAQGASFANPHYWAAFEACGVPRSAKALTRSR